MKISFCWQGISKVGHRWKDGLYGAMKIIESDYNVEYIEPSDEITGDVILYWEAPCTYNSGEFSKDYRRIQSITGKKKILLFAGGPIEKKTVEGFDIVCVESEINEKELSEIGVNWIRAFGVNTDIFKPMQCEKKYKAFMQATFADWKRHELFAKTFGNDGCVAGRLQDHDRNGYNECIRRGVTVYNEKSYEDVAILLNESDVVVNTANYWGGGQRCTLEAMACGIPVVVMSDSPKNCEYVIESGAGLISEPEPEKILKCVDEINSWTEKEKLRGVEYVMSKWTHKHYAKNLITAICS